MRRSSCETSLSTTAGSLVTGSGSTTVMVNIGLSSTYLDSEFRLLKVWDRTLYVPIHSTEIAERDTKIVGQREGHWIQTLHNAMIDGIFLLPQIYKVRSHCTEGYEFGCIWTHDEKSPLRWVPDSESGQSFVRLTGCPQNECGIAVMQSPWLEPRDREAKLVLHYKLYGTSEVFLRLYLKTEDAGGQQTLFSKEGNYKFTFPKEWKSKEVVIPPTLSRHRLILKANIPYPQAYVAVKGINLDAARPPCTTEEAEIFSDLLDFPDEYEEEDDRADLYREDEDRYEVEKLKNGYTKVMDPHICKYRKPRRMKFR
ncbi:hypothetical protein HNY73_013673 [Argiope bruennichi]|uniref:MAM domain-containing protein n=1 Tax=Argiope bruennichi TaxID=94029 RepID=A0A8T0F3J8_ARGBR|nr:hypothetical protein HNY73_013673 [Argiope bruennichi]